MRERVSSVLIIGDESLSGLIQERLKVQGTDPSQILTAPTIAEAKIQLDNPLFNPSLVVLSEDLPDGSGLSLLFDKLRGTNSRFDKDTPHVLVIGDLDPDNLVQRHRNLRVLPQLFDNQQLDEALLAA